MYIVINQVAIITLKAITNHISSEETLVNIIYIVVNIS